MVTEKKMYDVSGDVLGQSAVGGTGRRQYRIAMIDTSGEPRLILCYGNEGIALLHREVDQHRAQRIARLLQLGQRFERNAMRAALKANGAISADNLPNEVAKLDTFEEFIPEYGQRLLNQGRLPWQGRTELDYGEVAVGEWPKPEQEQEQKPEEKGQEFDDDFELG